MYINDQSQHYYYYMDFWYTQKNIYPHKNTHMQQKKNSNTNPGTLNLEIFFFLFAHVHALDGNVVYGKELYSLT